MGLDLFLLLYRRIVLAIWGGCCLQVEETWRQVLDLVVAMVLESLDPLRGLAWVLLLGVVVLGLVFLLGLVAQGFRYLLALGDSLVLV